MVESFGDRDDYESTDTWNITEGTESQLDETMDNNGLLSPVDSEQQARMDEFVDYWFLSLDSSNWNIPHNLTGDEQVQYLESLIHWRQIEAKIPSDEIKALNFWLSSNQPKNEKLMAKFNQDKIWNDSIEWQLMQNEQVQLLLSDALSDFNKYLWDDKECLRALIEQEIRLLKEFWEQGNITDKIDDIYQYLLSNYEQEWFEGFIIDDGVDIIKSYLENHVIDWKLSFISAREIKAKLKIEWVLNLYKSYAKKCVESGDTGDSKEFGKNLTNLVGRFRIAKDHIDGMARKFIIWELSRENLAEKLKKLFESADNVWVWTLQYNESMELMRYTIREYARWLDTSGDKLWYTWDNVFDTQIRCYLYLYWMYAYNKNLSGGWLEWIKKFDPSKWLDDAELMEILNAILITSWDKQDEGTNNKYLVIEQNIRKNQIVHNLETRKEAWMKIKAMESTTPKIDWKLLSQRQEKRQKLDVQNATWVEIAQDRGLWSEISGFDRKVWGTDILPLQRPVLMETWKSFIAENQEVLSNYMDITDLVKFLDVSENGVSFNSSNWESRISNHPEISTSEADLLRAILQWFPGKYQENLAKAMKLIDEKMDSTHDVIKNYAIGAIIDNIKDMFQYIVDTNTTWSFMTGFEFDENNSAKIENNCLLLSGKFNWENMNIKYDLNTWKLYMNSFIDVSSGNITLTWSSNPTSEIWVLQPFDSILYEFYKAPTESMNTNILSNMGNSPMSGQRGNSPTPETTGNTPWWEQQEAQPTPPPSMPNLSEMRDKMKREHKIMFQKMCGTKLDEIGRKIRDKIEAKSTCEPVALNLLNTLWITLDPNWTKNLKWWDDPSDLYKVIQLITKEKNSANINSFSDYMKAFIGNIWLSRWENNGHQDKTGDIARIIFDKNNKQNTIKYIRDNAENFDNEYSAASGKAQFDEKSNFWILKIIEEKFTEWEYPNRKLSTDKINEFEEWLATDIKDVKYKNTVKEIEKKDVAEADDLMKWLDDLDLV